MARIEKDIYVNDEYLNLSDDDLKPMIRLTIKRKEKFFGPGVATLLHLIDEHGSIQSAAKYMNMSYSKAWKIIKRAEEELGFQLLVSKNGGVGGGSSELSEKGRDFLSDYDSFTAEVKDYTARISEKYFKNLKNSETKEVSK